MSADYNRGGALLGAPSAAAATRATANVLRTCAVCGRPEGIVRFASDEAVRCTDCIRAHGAAVSTQKRSAAGRKTKASTLRARARAAREPAEDAALQERAALRAAARGESYVMKTVLSAQERLVLQSEDETVRRLEREVRRGERARDMAERAGAVARRKAEPTFRSGDSRGTRARVSRAAPSRC